VTSCVGGIAPHDIPQLFVLLFQLHNSLILLFNQIRQPFDILC
jgi:hypothetical protein